MAKKSFNTTTPAAAAFISTPATEPAAAAGAIPAGYKMDPRYIETKSRRVQLLMQPSLYTRLKAEATAQGLSLNEYIHKKLEEAVQGE